MTTTTHSDPQQRTAMQPQLAEDELIHLPLLAGDSPALLGKIRCRASDFLVEEIPAYEADGSPHAHLLLSMTKENWSSEAALEQVALQLGARREELGMAGLKDRHARTIQQISVPARYSQALNSFRHPEIELGPAQAHRNKLRTGHLRGNRFRIVVRELPRHAMTDVSQRLERLRITGLLNHYGVQRFGRGGANLARAQTILRKPLRKRSARGRLMCSVGQSAVFNAYCRLRALRGLLNTAQAGDVLQKSVTGGSFVCEQPELDTARISAGELRITGPMPGSKYMSGPPDSPGAQLETEAAALAGYADIANIIELQGKRMPGSRRPILLPCPPLQITEIPNVSPTARAPSPGGIDTTSIMLSFELPAGSYATNLLRELLGQAPIDASTPEQADT